jgi:hypothetical protein
MKVQGGKPLSRLGYNSLGTYFLIKVRAVLEGSLFVISHDTLLVSVHVTVMTLSGLKTAHLLLQSVVNIILFLLFCFLLFSTSLF